MSSQIYGFKFYTAVQGPTFEYPSNPQAPIYNRQDDECCCKLCSPHDLITQTSKPPYLPPPYIPKPPTVIGPPAPPPTGRPTYIVTTATTSTRRPNYYDPGIVFDTITYLVIIRFPIIFRSA